MLRLTEIHLPLDHAEPDLQTAILARLKIGADALLGYTIFRRSIDARKKHAIKVTYTLDVAIKDEAQIFDRLHGEPHVAVTPDTEYHFVAHAPSGLTSRPVVIGSGPCGLFAALILAQMGFRPIVLERG